MSYPDGRHAEQPTYQQPVYQHPGYQQQPGYQQPAYQPPAPAYQHPPAYQEPPYQQPAPAWHQYQQQEPWPQPEPEQPPPPAREEAPADGHEINRVTGMHALLRGRMLERLISVNASHAGHAADRVRTKDDLCEHALALFSVDPEDKVWTISTATRLSLSDSSNAGLVDMLAGLVRVTEQKLGEAGTHGRRWDPRTPLTGVVNRCEELRRSMIYVGLGISTLDTPEMPWRKMKGNVDRYGGLHLRGQGYLFLDDETAVHFHRAAQLGGQTGAHQITASKPIQTQYPWRRDSDMIENADQRTYQVWDQLRRLHQLFVAATSR